MIDLATLGKLAKEYGISKLHEKTKVSRSHIYGILRGDIDPKLSTLTKVLNCLNYEVTMTLSRRKSNLANKDFLRWSLAYYGAPIMASRIFNRAPDLNELLLQALKQGRIDVNINTILPIFIYKNRENFDWNYIIDNSGEDKFYLGYLLNLLNQIRNLPKIAYIYSRIHKQLKLSSPRSLIIKSKIGRMEKRKLENSDNQIARSWNFLTLDTIESSRARFNKWS